MPLAPVLAFEGLVLITAAFQHSKPNLRTGCKETVSSSLITPPIHWVHHHATRADTGSNYAAVFSFWDPLFGSRSPTEHSPDL
ncbi:MAG: sterol desaturase family protein [Alphaproteobacteria bacterium]|nr:sterol desaturase family protein [Alphaproteobacteria bacterium]